MKTFTSTTRVRAEDLVEGDVFLEQGDAVTVVGPPRKQGGLILLDLEGAGNTYRYEPTEIVARVSR